MNRDIFVSNFNHKALFPGEVTLFISSTPRCARIEGFLYTVSDE